MSRLRSLLSLTPTTVNLSPVPDGCLWYHSNRGQVLASSAGVTGHLVTPMISQGIFAVAGRSFIAPPLGTGNPASTGMTASTIYLIPMPINRAVTVDQVSIHLASTGSTMYLGYYAANTDGSPGSLIQQLGSIDASTSGRKDLPVATSPAAMSLATATMYWFAVAFTATAPNVYAVGGTPGSPYVSLVITSPAATILSCLTATFSGSTLPATVTATSGVGGAPRIALRAYSTP